MIEQLISKGYIWQSRPEQSIKPGLPTGFTTFDQLLRGQGWPSAGVIEILCNKPGIGEISLLLPHLVKLSQTQAWQLWINPPMSVNAAALAQAGMDLRYLVLVNTKTAKDTLWATEEAIKSALPQTVLCWPQKLSSQEIRRLHLCATQYQTPNFLFRRADSQPSISALKVKLQASDHDALHIEILKQQLAPAGQTLTLQLARVEPFRYPRPILNN